MSFRREYDDAGNVTLAYSADLGTSYKYEYDHLCRLTAIYDDTGTDRSAAFVYDALGGRVQFADDGSGSTPAAHCSNHWAAQP